MMTWSSSTSRQLEDHAEWSFLQFLIPVHLSMVFSGLCVAPCHVTIKKGTIASTIWGSRPVAVPLMPKLKQELGAFQDQKISSKLTNPTDWVHPIVINSKRRWWYSHLRGFHMSLSMDHPANAWKPIRFHTARTNPPGMRLFTVINALKCYHHVELDEESSFMTTFSTPFGSYKYNHLPFGVFVAGDDYGRRLAKIFDDFPNFSRVVEDIRQLRKTRLGPASLLSCWRASNRHQRKKNRIGG